MGSVEVGSAEVGSVEIGFAEVSKAEAGSAEVGSGEIGFAEAGSAEAGIAEVGKAEVGSAEVGKAEVRKYLWMFFSPLIPVIYTFQEQFEVLLICHLFSSSSCFHYKCTEVFQQEVSLFCSSVVFEGWF